jgi:hypothetical protein
MNFSICYLIILLIFPEFVVTSTLISETNQEESVEFSTIIDLLKETISGFIDFSIFLSCFIDFHFNVFYSLLPTLDFICSFSNFLR